MFSGGAHWQGESLSTSEERPDGHPRLTLMVKRRCWWRGELREYCPAAWRIPFGPSANGVPHSGMDQKQTLLRTTQAQSQQLGPSWTQGQFPVLGTDNAPHGFFPLSLLVPRDGRNPTGHSPASHSHHSSWRCIFQGPFVVPMDICSAGPWPPAHSKRAASSRSGNSDVARQEREEKSHLFPRKLLPSSKSPATAQDPQSLGESLPSPPLPRAPRMMADNSQPCPGKHHAWPCAQICSKAGAAVFIPDLLPTEVVFMEALRFGRLSAGSSAGMQPGPGRHDTHAQPSFEK